LQRLLKLSIKRSAHRDIVDEALSQIEAGKPAAEIKLNTTVGVLRDRSVGWIVQAINDLSDPAIVMKAFEMSGVDDRYNFSQASLTSQDTLARLRRLPHDDPALHAELTQGDLITLPSSDVEEEPFLDVDVYDDCDIPLDVVTGLLVSGSSSVTAKFAVGENGGLARAGDAEKSDAEAE
ncbi:hypothetical protein FB451DRAFT_953720, partial [Mycena latifolia]